MSNPRLLSPRFVVLTLMIVAAAAFRVAANYKVIHVDPNFAPIGAMALFGGACFLHRRAGLLVPLLAMLLSDVFINISKSPEMVRASLALMLPIYGSFAIIVLLGYCLRGRKRVVEIVTASLLGSFIFFVITNFAWWAVWGGYAYTFDGLSACFVAALPHFRATLAGDLVFTGMLFGSLWLFELAVPKLRDPASANVSEPLAA